MKTKKYKKIVEDNGYRYYETNYSISALKYSEEDYDIEIKVGKLRPGVLEVNIKGFCGDESDMILAAMELAETPPEDREEECAMTSFFRQKIEELGFQTRDSRENYIVANMNGNLIAIISKNIRKQINTDFVAWDELSDKKKDMLFDLFIRFTSTPPEDREEESFLTTKEFIEKVNNLGFNVEIIKDENPFSPMYGKDSILKIWCEEELVAKIWLASTYAINTYNEIHAVYRSGYDLDALYRLCFEYAKTPVCCREEEEKDKENRPNWMIRWLGEPVRDCERETSDYEVGRQDMSDKYVFKFTLEQAEVINKLIGFKLSECVAWKASEYEETIELSRSLNRQIGYFHGLENNMGLKDD